MDEVTIGDLRDHADDVVERVLRGECLKVMRRGRPVAELRPLPRPGLEAATLLKRWRNLPAVDPDRLRRDIDVVIDHDPQGNLRNGPCRHRD
jgi:antitoxin (DNA-binding transcriptional repressor) of toxin-antitoxin stability system